MWLPMQENTGEVLMMLVLLDLAWSTVMNWAVWGTLILQLERRLQDQFEVRCTLEKALGYRPSSLVNSNKLVVPKEMILNLIHYNKPSTSDCDLVSSWYLQELAGILVHFLLYRNRAF